MAVRPLQNATNSCTPCRANPIFNEGKSRGMSGRVQTRILLALSLIAATLAGCADAPVSDDDDPFAESGKKIEATSTTGGIRGVVVDTSIVPIAGATVKVLGQDMEAVTDEQGLFVFSGLDAGFYTLEATALFYDSVQTTAEVVAGVSDPAAIKVLLNRVINDVPYSLTLKFDGFIYCSMNVVGAYAEECGEGVGYPCELPPTIYGCGDRVGKNDQNKAGQEWYVDHDGISTMVIEQHWTPSLEVSASGGGQFRTFQSVNWLCDPWCGDDHRFGVTVSNSPLYSAIDMEGHKPALSAMDPPLGPDMRMTTFTYAADNPGVLIEQSYEQFVSLFYTLPAPEGWSFINGDEHPSYE